MVVLARIRTIRGLAPSDDEVTDDDILEVDGEAAPSSRVGRSVPPVSVPAPCKKGTRYSMRYSMVAPRRRPSTLRFDPAGKRSAG